MVAENEVWLPVVGWETDYEVSNHGRVRRSSPRRGTKVGRIMQTQPNSKGYMRASLRRSTARAGEHPTFRFVHSLVAEAFIGPRPTGLVIAHGDGNHLNNRLDNLRYCCPKENEADKILHGTKVEGSANGSSKLCESDIVKIRARHVWGSPVDGGKALANEFGVCRATMRKALRGETWKSVRS